MKYLRVRNWERYQHYKSDNAKRRVVWVKLYTSMLRDTELRRLPIATRLLWDQLLLLAAEYENSIPNDLEELSFATRIPLVSIEEGVEQLVEGGWISRSEHKPRASKAASSVLADGYQDACSEQNRTEKEEEQEAEQTTARKLEPIDRLLEVCYDRDQGTRGTVAALALRYRLAEGDFEFARTCATGPGVISPTAVAVSTLIKRGEGKAA